MPEAMKFSYGGKKYRIEVPWSGSSRISVRVYCAHHEHSSINLGSVWSKRPGLRDALMRKVKRGQRTRKPCHNCKKVEGMVDRAYAALRPLLVDDEGGTK